MAVFLSKAEKECVILTRRLTETKDSLFGVWIDAIQEWQYVVSNMISCIVGVVVGAVCYIGDSFLFCICKDFFLSKR